MCTQPRACAQGAILNPQLVPSSQITANRLTMNFAFLAFDSVLEGWIMGLLFANGEHTLRLVLSLCCKANADISHTR